VPLATTTWRRHAWVPESPTHELLGSQLVEEKGYAAAGGEG
jgi:hypothetical protein